MLSGYIRVIAAVPGLDFPGIKLLAPALPYTLALVLIVISYFDGVRLQACVFDC